MAVESRVFIYTDTGWQVWPKRQRVTDIPTQWHWVGAICPDAILLNPVVGMFDVFPIRDEGMKLDVRLTKDSLPELADRIAQLNSKTRINVLLCLTDDSDEVF